MARGGVEAGGRRRKSRDALTSRPEIERLLDAARAPAGPRELAGEHAAVDLFARARLMRAAAAAETPSRSPRTGVKAAVASVAVVVATSSGVAFATTGHMPFAGSLKQVTGQGAGPASDGQSEDSSGPTTEASDSSAPDSSAPDSSAPKGPTAAALPGLCRAFARGQKATHGHALEARPFTVLVEAAGGPEQVEEFCASLPPHAGGSHPSHPTHPTHPTKPTKPTHPNARPTDLPTPSAPGESHASAPSKPTQAAEPTHQPRPTDKPSRTDLPIH
jgi:hypothetical protein